jgi:hypothetical protein
MPARALLPLLGLLVLSSPPLAPAAVITFESLRHDSNDHRNVPQVDEYTESGFRFVGTHPVPGNIPRLRTLAGGSEGIGPQLDSLPRAGRSLGLLAFLPRRDVLPCLIFTAGGGR